MMKKGLATTNTFYTIDEVLRNKRNMGDAMRTLWFVCFLAIAFAVSCDGDNQATKDIEVIGDEEPVIDGADADTADLQPSFRGTQSWAGVLPTGQNKCYDLEKEINCPEPGEPLFGQDGQFGQWKTRSFTPNANGTVYDDVTHRTWQAGYSANLNWQEAFNYCASLPLAGKTWRLPNPHELKSLINYGKMTGVAPNEVPAHPATDFPGTTPLNWFWTSNRIQDTVTAWIIYFYDGYMDYTVRTNKYSVRCVATE